jgi:hypothetical protein
LEVVNAGENPEPFAALLRACLESVRPTPGFRLKAWREFQRALDPLAPPKELPRQFRA